ncbi:MAG: nicotinate-nucleotide--dimethylbenzimidazole phosphoribosyltransferase [Nitrosomonadales bacterium]|nr:MAG: nicotinate-nucleotide--dimethylbenzimidazole phosphoribosyltransferase [Nitrosomonadales bacterium]
MTSSPAFDIRPHAPHLQDALKAKIDGKTKPLGALGRLEALALQIGSIQDSLEPRLARPVILVFAGDHGITQDGVSSFPQEVTYQMVLNFLSGGAAINVFARQHGMALRVVDAGVKGEFQPHPELVDAKIGHGTQSFLRMPAMSDVQCETAIARGADLARAEIAAGSNVLGFGEMGIGNTSSAAALMSVLCALQPAQCVGRGTGLDDDGVRRKCAILEQALALHSLDATDPMRALAVFGGFEIAMMAGAMLGAAEGGALLLIDGFIATSALLVASRLHPAIIDYCVFSHRSGEAGHARLLEELKAVPLLDLGMRLGEGTGAAMAYPIVVAAVNFLNQMASFESAGVSESSQG